jgi:hypothetical protein
MSTTQVSPLPIILGVMAMLSCGKSNEKTKKGTHGTKKCATCGGGAKNNKQGNCHHCAENGLVVNNWLKKEKVNNGGKGKECPDEDCKVFTKGNRAHYCKCGAQFPAKSKCKAYGKRKKRSEESGPKKMKRNKVGPHLPACTMPTLDSSVVQTVPNEPQVEIAAFDIDFDTLFGDEPENTPTGDYYLAPGFENSNDQQAQQPGPIELTRSNSLTPSCHNSTGDEPIGLFSGSFDAQVSSESSLTMIPLERENSLEPITFDYSDHKLPRSEACIGVYENEEHTLSDFSTWFQDFDHQETPNYQELTV